jgi:WD40 repeat protein
VATCTGHDGKVYALATTSEFIFSGGLDGKIRVWEPLSGASVASFSDHSALVGLLQIHGNLLVAGSTDGAMSLWDARTLQRLRHVEFAHRSSLTAIDINRYAVITGSERALRLWPLGELRSDDEPPEPLVLSDKMDVVWRVAMGETLAAVAYQQMGITRIDILSFAPS